ncbi:enoyl-CoA hydratase/isomerase family protein [Marinobacter sp.]|uniref:enoyl-CoA hydratase/isomerase family protein n=1 Tax=Marinobacter sp. TaxID=50741 RepID=UPI00199550C9|nr:enoyl-CoA hydratase/isomerase family protein [Marinobacter sp.]MBC7191200.1 enoyl-CoA hydratase/isomerase family protein [Marinobacter sp.]
MSIQVQELECMEGMLGQIILDAPASLNSLTLDMVEQMQQTLDRWAEDPRICLVVLQGSGDRAFCAGGNIRNLYGALTGKEDRDAPVRFFTAEYRLDYSIHRFPKPILGLAHGVTMGGGLGLLSGCRYRLATTDLTLAMPEVSIGLFPDVGASHFLNRLPGRTGLFLGLTGARLNISDALRIGLVDMAISDEVRSSLVSKLQEQRWTGNLASDDSRLFRLLNQLDTLDYHALPASPLARHEQDIARLIAGDQLPGIVDRLVNADITSDWWQQSVGSLRDGCPVTAWLVWRQLREAQQLTLRDVFRMELAMALECIRRPDLSEGIRARLVDRDQSPVWSYPTVRDVPEEVVDRHFQPCWTDADCPMGLSDSVLSG